MGGLFGLKDECKERHHREIKSRAMHPVSFVLYCTAAPTPLFVFRKDTHYSYGLFVSCWVRSDNFLEVAGVGSLVTTA